MKPIGGYFELECGHGKPYHENGLYFNSGRNALRYLIRGLRIKHIHIPRFTCKVVEEAIEKENCKITYYNINPDLYPISEFKSNDFILYNNYFGVCGNKVKKLANIYPNLIVDNAQSFYSPLIGRAVFYSPRKFFGIPDGGILLGQNIPTNLNLKKGTSYQVCSHLLKRFDLGAKDSYQDFIDDELIIDNYQVEKMSKLTYSLLGNINYNECKKKRVDNFTFIKENLNSHFPMEMSENDVPLIYPYYIKEGEFLRNILIKNNIFCARYWPNIFTDTHISPFELDLTKNLVCIPIDQRYNKNDMSKIVNIIKNYGY